MASPVLLLNHFNRAWRLSRQFGRALSLRRKGDPTKALTVALDGLEDGLRSKFHPSAAIAPGVISTMIELTMLVDELARQLERPELAESALNGMVASWDRAVGFQKEWTPEFQNLSPRSSRSSCRAVSLPDRVAAVQSSVRSCVLIRR